MTAFYRSPVGQRMTREAPSVARESGAIGQQWGESLKPAMTERLMARMKREGFAPERDIIAAFTADEEAGGDANGPAFLLKDHFHWNPPDSYHHRKK